MLRSRKRRLHHTQHIWPGFVDALSTLLMVVIFVLMLVFMGQFFLSFTLQHKEKDLANLQAEMGVIQQQLTHKSSELEKTLEDRKSYADRVQNLEALLNDLKNNLGNVHKELNAISSEKDEAVEAKTQLLAIEKDLVEQIASLNSQIQELTKALQVSETESDVQKQNMHTLQEKLDMAMEQIRTQNKKLEEESVTAYRSEFFSKLKGIIGDRSDMRVVGDRFVFQSEVFFNMASSELSDEGKKQLDQLAKVLEEITSKIPSHITWILRVDGHTDQLLIHNNKFSSNWELSSARAISVVKHLIHKGVAPNRLVAAGFAENQPLITKGDREELAPNRRIEFKLDQR